MRRCLFLSKLLVIGLFVIAISSPVHALREGVVGIWLFDENTGDEVADSSGNENTGKAANGNLEWGDGKFGTAGKFAPGGAYLEVADADMLDLETFTVESWVNITDNGGGEQNIIVKQPGLDRGTRNFTSKTWAGLIYANFASGGDGNYCKLSGQTNVGDGDWHHVAMTYDGTTAKLYIDGIVEADQVLGERKWRSQINL